MWRKQKPNLSNLKIFGSIVYIHNKNNPAKFDPKSSKGILVGYESNGYKIWHLDTYKL